MDTFQNRDNPLFFFYVVCVSLYVPIGLAEYIGKHIATSHWQYVCQLTHTHHTQKRKKKEKKRKEIIWWVLIVGSR